MSYENIIPPGHFVFVFFLNSSVFAPWTHNINETQCYLSLPSSCTQWAAVTSQFGLMMDAPQTCPLFLTWRLTCQGNSPSSAAWPPTIRVLNILLPQSAKQTQNHNLACSDIGVTMTPQRNQSAVRDKSLGFVRRTTVGLIRSILAVVSSITFRVQFSDTFIIWTPVRQIRAAWLSVYRDMVSLVNQKGPIIANTWHNITFSYLFHSLTHPTHHHSRLSCRNDSSLKHISCSYT